MILDYNMAHEFIVINEAVEKINKAMSSIGVHTDNSWLVLTGEKNDEPVEIDGLGFDWENIEELIGIKTDKIQIGLSISTGPICLHGKYIQPPEDFEIEKAKILEEYMLKELQILKKNIKCFTIDFDDFGLESDNVDGWEHWMGFILKSSYYHSEESLINDLINEEDDVIEFAYRYNNPINANRPPGEWKCMLEFFSTHLICSDEDNEYFGDFGEHEMSGKYIRECMSVINNVENKVQKLKEKYEKYDIQITIGDFNIGCECGMAVYIWIPK